MTQYKYGDGEKNYGPRGQVRTYICAYMYVLDDWTIGDIHVNDCGIVGGGH
jgi:hypothetical protein